MASQQILNSMHCVSEIVFDYIQSHTAKVNCAWRSQIDLCKGSQQSMNKIIRPDVSWNQKKK